ncbi:precorrin-3B C17-methyltransferase [Clostridium punense]|uniref:Precorrin-3B C17-methyltransferase n=1 Tax=Clostridium punense TaxID=1054297 RepID=A0ABS4K4P3_9CLOT|nr:precorrin-3B C(17)-methyltransferase [Clostridium punense]MBP2021604.1 precorrin-3B C17-methyltransferase [Clostridium punense]
MGKLYVVGIGPGGQEHMTLKAVEAIKESNVIVGYSKYMAYIEHLIEGKQVVSTGMKGEEERCRQALQLCKDNTVAIISTGEAGIYGMAGLILEMAQGEEIEVVPGVTASSAAASVLGAPLMHDNCNISLSDLLTPYELIKKRIRMAADGDFVISLYNPKSIGRPHYLMECINIIREYRNENTPVSVVKNALRPGQEIYNFILGNFDDSVVDMMSIVIIGNSSSYYKEGKFLTPRGYKL